MTCDFLSFLTLTGVCFLPRQGRCQLLTCSLSLCILISSRIEMLLLGFEKWKSADEVHWGIETRSQFFLWRCVTHPSVSFSTPDFHTFTFHFYPVVAHLFIRILVNCLKTPTLSSCIPYGLPYPYKTALIPNVFLETLLAISISFVPSSVLAFPA